MNNSEKGIGIGFEYAVEPPVLSVNDLGCEQNILLQLQAADWLCNGPQTAEVYVARIGEIEFPFEVPLMPSEPFVCIEDAVKAISLFKSQLPVRVILVFTLETLMQERQKSSESLVLLQQAGFHVDVLCLGAGETVSLVQLLVPFGGRVLRATPETLEKTLKDAIQAAAQQPYQNLSIELEFSKLARPRAVFTCSPEPCFLGEIHCERGERRVLLDVGPFDPMNPPSWLITLRMPQRREGRYRLLDVRLNSGETVLCQASVCDEVSALMDGISMVEPRVIATLERVLPLAWFDELLVARQRNDVRQMAMLQERMLRHFATLGLDEAVDQLRERRLSFLHSGLLDDNALAVIEKALRSSLVAQE